MQQGTHVSPPALHVVGAVLYDRGFIAVGQGIIDAQAQMLDDFVINR